ncbi:M20 family metallo-hydrolase [Paeniglutamicibacter gangotriensis]|uniref:M20 family metallo-hydrolase n=1 Tax=Paeniglutamicibacter gangotriensis TaxID=254787 RepID=A0A5B0E6G3_9MICC|nr:M20 family metallo-hydrolase [Paeniglutamicibacter gangotriensis]KAA0973360.1 M20 family metallo-hydrolase [Paeniglutamicibacter gangotriensis]
MTSESFLTDFHYVAKIGSTPKQGVDREAATEDDRRTRDWFKEFAFARGWEIRVDAIGNLFALVTWHPEAKYVVVGSHLDSQPLGGRFDGAYGVIAALHAAARIAERVANGAPLPDFNLAVVDWFNEEGGRFPPSIMGSSVYAGVMNKEQMLNVCDLSGISVAEALSSIGYLGVNEAPEAVSYAEIHIEQGRVLEKEQLKIGAVDSSWYTQKLDIEVLGEQSHTGATAMADRHDALVAAAKIVLMVQDVTKDFDPQDLVSSVGRLTLEPNSPIVVAGRVRMVADLRSNSSRVVLAARSTLLKRIADLELEQDIVIKVRDFDVREQQYFPESGVELTQKVAANLGFEARRMQTMAGHDSVAMNHIVPAVMVFIPSVDGVSHCEREFTSDEDMSIGVDVLTDITWELLGGALVKGTEQTNKQ